MRKTIRKGISNLVHQIEVKRKLDVDVFIADDVLMWAEIECVNGELTLKRARLDTSEKAYSNISNWIEQQLNKELSRINENTVYHNDGYKKNYETIGGRYAHHN